MTTPTMHLEARLGRVARSDVTSGRVPSLPWRRFRPMPRTYVTDIQHLLDDSGQPALGPAGDMARYLARIVEAGSVIPVGKGRLEPLRCTNPSHRRRCGGQLGVVIPSTGTIEWECVGCRERGVITNWAGTAFDLSQVATPKPGDERVDLVAPLAELDAVLRRCELARPLRRLLVDASGIGDEYLFVLADYGQLIELRDATSRAAEAVRGIDGRMLDRFIGRVDGLATTLSAFLEADDLESGSLLN